MEPGDLTAFGYLFLRQRKEILHKPQLDVTAGRGIEGDALAPGTLCSQSNTVNQGGSKSYFPGQTLNPS